MNFIKRIRLKYNQIPLAAKASLWFMCCSILQKSVSLVTTPIFTRLMSAEQYGQYSIYNSWLQVFTILTTLRLNFAVFNKGMSKYREDRDGYTSTMQTITVICTSVIAVFYVVFHTVINEVIELPSFIMIAIIVELFFTPAIDFWTIRERYEYRYKSVVFVTLAISLLNSILGVIAVIYSNEKGYARILSCILVNTIFGIVLFYHNRKKGKKWFVGEYAKFAITFNLPLLLHYFSIYIMDQFDRIMIQKMVGVAAAGLYSVAYTAGLIMKIVTQSINSALVPWQYEKLEKKEFKVLDDILFLILLLVATCTLAFTAFAPELMQILAGREYYEAIYVIPPVAISVFFTFMYTIFANVEFFYNQNKFTMYVSILGAILNVVLNYIGIKYWGYVAAAYTTLICYACFAFAHYFCMVRCIENKFGTIKVFNGKRIAILSVCLLCVGMLIICLYSNIYMRYMLLTLLVVCIVSKRETLLQILRIIKKRE